MGILRAEGALPQMKRILVATNGSYFSGAAVEMALRYAENVDGHVTVLYWMEAEQATNEYSAPPTLFEQNFRRMMATTVLLSMTPLLGTTTARVSVVVAESEQPTPPVIAEVQGGLYDLLVVGAENRAVLHRLSVGYDCDRIVDEAPCTVLVVVPKVLAPHGAAA
jgi:nucleotide-binding universal stress UspA family protein